MSTLFRARRTRESSPARGFSRTLRRVALALSAAAVLPVVSATSADAVLYNGGGLIAAYSTSQASCESRLFGTTRYVSMSAAPLRVLAKDKTPGAGNDWAWIRYAAYVKNETTGAWVVVPSSWSTWSLAKDNVAATWPYADSFQVAAASSSFRIHYVIEWWNSTSRTGWVADSLQSYRLTDQTSVSRGTFNDCAYLTGMYLRLY